MSALKAAEEILKQAGEALHYREITDRIVSRGLWSTRGKTPEATVRTELLLNIKKHGAGSPFEKVGRGLFALRATVVGNTGQSDGSPTAQPQRVRVRESAFYESFAEYLKGDLDEVIEAVALGGSVLKGRWATPDVVGVFRREAADPVNFSPEIVSAEIKVDPAAVMQAFGQAMTYRLFSSKTYVVVPMPVQEEYDRLEALCLQFGVGLVVFDGGPDSPNYQRRLLAQKAHPDMFWVNQFADRLRDHDRKMFNALFPSG